MFSLKNAALKKILIFSQKSPKVSGNGNPENFLCLKEQNFLIFWEKYIQNPSIFRIMTYLEP